MSLRSRLQDRFIRVHEWVYERSGRVGHRLAEVRSLLLRTTGRRTGQTRTVVLVYSPDGDDYVVTASNNAQDHPPAWLLNLQADPNVTIKVGRREGPALASPVWPGDPDYDRLWDLVNDGNHGRYRRYQERTDRPIPVVRLRLPRT